MARKLASASREKERRGLELTRQNLLWPSYAMRGIAGCVKGEIVTLSTLSVARRCPFANEAPSEREGLSFAGLRGCPRAVLGFASVAWGLGRGLSGLRRAVPAALQGPPHPRRGRATGTSPNRACRLTFSTPSGSCPPPESPLQHPVIYGAFQASALATAHPRVC